MALTGTLKNWALSSYTVSTWTDIADPTVEASIKSLVISNTSGSAIICGLRLTDSSGTELAQILVPQSVEAGYTGMVNLPIVELEAGQKIQGYADTAGVQFLLSGMI